MEIMYKPFPSKINIGLWNVAKRQFIIKRGGWKFVSNKSVPFKTKKEVQTEADKPNMKHREDEKLCLTKRTWEMKQIMTFVKTLLALTLCFASCNGNNSSRSQSSEKSIVAKEIIRSNVYIESQRCPIDFRNGTICESAIYDYMRNVIQYKYLVSGLKDDVNIIESKKALLNTIKGAYIVNILNCKSFWDAIIEAETKVIYNYYTIDGKNLNIEILSSEIDLFIHSN